MSDDCFDVAIVGGGASGMLAAIVAASSLACASKYDTLHSSCARQRICIVEKNARLGIKLLTTGNGRCNLSNAAIAGDKQASNYNDPAFSRQVLAQYDYEYVIEYFKNLGLLTVTDERGWVYPRTRWANSVLDVLRLAVERNHIDLLLNTEVVDINLAQSGFNLALRKSVKLVKQLEFKQGDAKDIKDTNDTKEVQAPKGTARHAKSICAQNVILATGAAVVYRGLPSLAQKNNVPILGPIFVNNKDIRGLDGVRTQASVGLYVNSKLAHQETGELLFRKDSVSGIVVFNLSRFLPTCLPDLTVTQNAEISINLLPEYAPDALIIMLEKRLQELHETTVGDFLTGILHNRLISAICKKVNLSQDKKCTIETLPSLFTALSDFRLQVTAAPPARQAQVTRGGYITTDFDLHTLESRLYPHLYACGECLDIDGPCGGYNLHWAWASGIAAGKAASGAG